MPQALLVLAVAGCAAPPSEPLGLGDDTDPWAASLEGAAHGFPALRTLTGTTLADGEFTQWLDGDRLHVRIRYDFGSARLVEESFVVRQEPLVQEAWSWVETRDGAIQRRFGVDFLSGKATAEKREEDELRGWSVNVDVAPGRVFAGAAWPLAIRSVRSQLIDGRAIEFQTVGFTPRPKAATVVVSYAGLERVPMGGRAIAGDHFRIHPQIPLVLRLFVDVPDSHIWLAHTPPAAFLRWEGPLAEPGDQLVRVDLLPGEPSKTAFPALQ